jgi:hypothetical protein
MRPLKLLFSQHTGCALLVSNFSAINYRRKKAISIKFYLPAVTANSNHGQGVAGETNCHIRIKNETQKSSNSLSILVGRAGNAVATLDTSNIALTPGMARGSTPSSGWFGFEKYGDTRDQNYYAPTMRDG